MCDRRLGGVVCVWDVWKVPEMCGRYLGCVVDVWACGRCPKCVEGNFGIFLIFLDFQGQFSNQ